MSRLLFDVPTWKGLVGALVAIVLFLAVAYFLVEERSVDALDQQPAVHVGLEVVGDLDQLARRGFRGGVKAGLDVLVHRGIPSVAWAA
jgi:hypothetical protein